MASAATKTNWTLGVTVLVGVLFAFAAMVGLPEFMKPWEEALRISSWCLLLVAAVVWLLLHVGWKWTGGAVVVVVVIGGAIWWLTPSEQKSTVKLPDPPPAPQDQPKPPAPQDRSKPAPQEPKPPAPQDRSKPAPQLTEKALQLLEQISPEFMATGRDVLAGLKDTDDVRIVNSLQTDYFYWRSRAKNAVSAYLGPTEAARFENLPSGTTTLGSIPLARLATMDDDHKTSIGNLDTRLTYLERLVDDVRAGKR